MSTDQQPSSFDPNSINWILQRVTAVILVFALAGHMIHLHFIEHAWEITFQDTQMRMERMWYFAAMWIFLVTAAFHGLNGVYQALIGFGVDGRKRTIAKWGLILAGTLLIVQGTRVALAMSGDFIV